MPAPPSPSRAASPAFSLFGGASDDAEKGSEDELEHGDGDGLSLGEYVKLGSYRGLGRSVEDGAGLFIRDAVAWVELTTRNKGPVSR